MTDSMSPASLHAQMCRLRRIALAALLLAAVALGSVVTVAVLLWKRPLSSANFAQLMEQYVSKRQAEQEKAREEARAKKQEEQRRAARENLPAITDADHVRGAKTAPITIVEYSDFECPFCKLFSTEIAQALEELGDTVNFVYRHFPLSIHDPLATKEAIASECAAELGGTKAFFAYHDAIFQLTSSNGNGLRDADLTSIAKDLGLNVRRFQQCRTSGRYDAHIKQDIAGGVNAGASGTPYTVVRNNATGDVRVFAGVVPARVIVKAVKDLLSQK